VNVFFVRRVDAVAPFEGLLIQVLPTGEGTARQEVIFDDMGIYLDSGDHNL
jgi:hypothetical protein